MSELLFFSFCVNIGRIQPYILKKAFQGLINSLHYFNNKFKFIIYTNLSLDEFKNDSSIIIREYKNFSQDYKDNLWLNLSINKLFYAKEIIKEFTKEPIWIDLDTIVGRNIEHLSSIKNFFIMQETNDTDLFHIINGLNVYNKDYIQGNIWKCDLELIETALDLLKNKNIKPDYDTQGLFNYMYHFYNYKTKMNILMRDMDTDTINGLNIGNKDKVTHSDFNSLKDLLYMENNIIKSKLYDNFKIQFLSFTFYSLQKSLALNEISLFEDNNIKNFLMKIYN
jgi:hypothetical protein